MRCEKMANKSTHKDSLDVAGRIYEVDDYKRTDTLSSGLAKTHEQVSDTFMEGETQPISSDKSDKVVEMKREELYEKPHHLNSH
jgi:Protein of unknown function (DUF4025)